MSKVRGDFKVLIEEIIHQDRILKNILNSNTIFLLTTVRISDNVNVKRLSFLEVKNLWNLYYQIIMLSLMKKR